MKRFMILFALLSLCLLASCQSLSPKHLGEVMQSWVGSPFNSLTASWGWPSQTLPSGLCDGCIAAVYVKPSASMAMMQASAMAGALASGNTAYAAGFGQGMNDAAQRNPALCYETFLIDANGMITGWRFQGACP